MVLETIYSCNCITLDSRAVFQIEMSLGQRPFYHAYAPLFDILPPAFKSFSQYVKFLLLPLRPCRLEYTAYWITGASVWRMSFFKCSTCKTLHNAGGWGADVSSPNIISVIFFGYQIQIQIFIMYTKQ